MSINQSQVETTFERNFAIQLLIDWHLVFIPRNYNLDFIDWETSLVECSAILT